jgi:biopolymer transport protein ExbB
MDHLAVSVTEASFRFLSKGGIFIYPLLLCSIAGLTAIGFKFLSLSRKRIAPEGLVVAMQHASGDTKGVRSRLNSHQSVLSRLAGIALKNQSKSNEQITQIVEATAREEVVKMHAGIGVLDVVITVAPLLGLLGTASGLVTIFQGLGDTTDYVVIARGIAEALTTTIFGLAIAVPCVVAHSYFTRRIERLTAHIEAIMTDFVSICSTLK